MRLDGNNLKTLAKYIAKIPRHVFERQFQLLNFFTPLAGPIYLIFLHESYLQNTFKIEVMHITLRKYLNYKYEEGVRKGVEVLEKLGLIKKEKIGHIYSYTLLNPKWDEILKNALSDENFNYLMKDICVSRSKKRNAEYYRTEFGKYYGIDDQELCAMVEKIRYDGLSIVIDRFSDISWKTKDVRCIPIEFNLTTLNHMEFRTKRMVFNSNHIAGRSNHMANRAAHFSTGLFDPSERRLPEYDFDKKKPLYPMYYYNTSKGLKTKNLSKSKVEPKVRSIQDNSMSYTVTIQPNTNVEYSQNYIVMQLKKAIKKWNSQYPIFSTNEMQLEEAVKPIRHYKLKKEQIYSYAEYVIYHEFLKVKYSNKSSLCSWFKKPERIERFLQHIATEKQEEKTAGFERYKREHRAKLEAKEKMGGRAGHAYEMSEKELKKEYEFEKLSPEEKREEIWKQFDVSDEWMDFIKRKMLKDHKNVTRVVQYFRRKKTGKVYVLVDGCGYWHKSKLQDILDGNKPKVVDLDANSPEG